MRCLCHEFCGTAKEPVDLYAEPCRSEVFHVHALRFMSEYPNPQPIDKNVEISTADIGCPDVFMTRDNVGSGERIRDTSYDIVGRSTKPHESHVPASISGNPGSRVSRSPPARVG